MVLEAVVGPTRMSAARDRGIRDNHSNDHNGHNNNTIDDGIRKETRVEGERGVEKGRREEAGVYQSLESLFLNHPFLSSHALSRHTDWRVWRGTGMTYVLCGLCPTNVSRRLSHGRVAQMARQKQT